MDFDFSDDQEQLREAVKRWVEKSYTFDKRRAIAKAGGFSSDAYAELAGLGLMAIPVAEAHGGMGMGPVEAMVVMEELGRGLVMEPLAQALMVANTLSKAPDALQGKFLPDLASGEAYIALAYAERKARYKLHEAESTATASAGTYTVTGRKTLVAAGAYATAFVVSAQLNGKLALLLVPNASAAVVVGAYPGLDGAALADIQMTDAPAHLITEDGLAALEEAIDVGIAALCAEGVGAMDRIVDITVDYLNTRKQFGVVISSFQALRHRVADMKMQLELARSMSFYASLKLGAPANERRAALARAKYQLGCSMRFVGQQAIQLHGGIAMTDEYVVSHYYKRLTQMEMTYGDTLHHLGEVSARMQDTAGVFA
jgi:alkylation response protein AidB-like acyl-CoA dehydrogenase